MKLIASRYRIRRRDDAATPAAPVAVAAPATQSAPAPQEPVAVSAAPATRQTAVPGPAAVAPDAAAPVASAPVHNTADAVPQPAPSAPPAPRNDIGAIEAELDAIRNEGLTGKQLRLARRVAQKHDLPATSDYDAVRVLRRAGIDPFQRANMMSLVAGDPAAPQGGSRELAPVPPPQPTLPAKPIRGANPQARADQDHISEIHRIQRDILRRRRRKGILLATRLFLFVLLPTLFAGWYFFRIATPFYSVRSEFVIQQSESAGGQGLGGLFTGTQFATSQDSMAVQGYLQSRDAMMRLDRDLGFRAHFSDAGLDPLQRLDPGATDEATYKVYKRNVKISYDPSEGLVRLEVSATNPETAVAFSKALIGYAEEQVDHLTRRLREDQMSGARDSYDEAEAKMLDAQRSVVKLQEKYKVLSSETEVSLITGQIAELEGQMLPDKLSLAQMEANETPNLARMEPVKRRIATIEAQITDLRAKLTEDSATGLSLAKVQSELLVAQADVQTRQLLLAQSLQQLESARIEANRQVRYLSLSVLPTAPDEPAYPRAFEDTMVTMLIFAGIYLMISMTAAILREQMTA